jgi:hypothetical protein
MLLLVDAGSGRLLLDPEFQILLAVVVANPVLVMHVLVRPEIAAQQLFHDEAMLEDVGVGFALADLARMIWDPDEHVAVLSARATFPSRSLIPS